MAVERACWMVTVAALSACIGFWYDRADLRQKQSIWHEHRADTAESKLQRINLKLDDLALNKDLSHYRWVVRRMSICHQETVDYMLKRAREGEPVTTPPILGSHHLHFPCAMLWR